MSEIADMVRRLISAGCDPTEAAVVLSEVYALGVNSTRIRVDETAEKRRAWDREYRRNRKQIPPDSTRIPPDPPESDIYIEVSKKEEEQVLKKVSKRRVRQIPPEWKPPERSLKLAAELGVSIPEIEATFRDYLASSGKQYADHDAAFCNFVRNAPRFNGARPLGPSAAVVPINPKDAHREKWRNAYERFSAAVDSAGAGGVAPESRTVCEAPVRFLPDRRGN